MRPTGARDWKRVALNQPVFTGTELYADRGATAETTLGDNRYLRFGDGADIDVTRLEPNYAQMGVRAGTMTLALNDYNPNEYYEVNAPGGAIIPQGNGSYRVDVDENGETWVTVESGSARITTPSGTFDETFQHCWLALVRVVCALQSTPPAAAQTSIDALASKPTMRSVKRIR